MSSRAQNISSTTSLRSESKSGLFSNGGLSVTIGKKQNSTDQKEQSTTAAASTVGSIGGNVNLIAGQTYRQVGSDVLAPQGDINILAKDVQIIEARETTASQTETKSKQSGLTLAVSNPIVSAVQGMQSIASATKDTSSGRAKALGAATMGLTGYNAYQGLTDKAGKFDPSKASDINVSISLGSSKSQSNSNSTSNTARGSTVNAGGNVNITATGAGKDSNLLIQGSEVKAGNNASLTADNQVNLLAAKNESSNKTTNSSSSGSIGMSLGSNTGVTVAASKGKGKSDGQDTTYTNTQVRAGNTASITSGGDTAVKGAVVSANQIKADIGGNLNIESLQDKSTYSSSQKSAGGSITFGPGGIPTGGSISASKSKIDSNFQSVGEQSGLKAGDGGFQVSVANNTNLTGGVIASTQTAVDSKANTFTTGGNLIITDVQNTASFKGTAVGGTIGVGSQLGSSGAGVGKMQGSAASTSSSGISGIAGNAAVRTGDAETGLKPIFNADKVQKDIDAQVKITTAFTQQAAKAVGDYAGKRMKEADAKVANAAIETDPDKKAALLKEAADIKDTWGEGKFGRVGLHTIIGALTGNVAGALGAGTSQALIPYIADAVAQLDAPLEVKQALIQIAGTAVGASVGGTSGGASALGITANNYLTHVELKTRGQQKKACDSGSASACQAVRDLDQKSVDRNTDIRNGTLVTTPEQANQILQDMQITMSGLANYKTELQAQFDKTSDPQQQAELKNQINQADNNMKQVANLGKDYQYALYQKTGDPRNLAAYAQLNTATNGNELADAMMMGVAALGSSNKPIGNAVSDKTPGAGTGAGPVSTPRVEPIAKPPVPGVEFAMVNGTKVTPEGYGTLYHGTDNKTLGYPSSMSADAIAQSIYATGLPARGANTDLISHTVDAVPNTAFRGATQQPLTQNKDAGASLWAGEGGIVIELKSVKGYDVNAALEGRVPKPGGFGGNPRPGELEIAVPGTIAAENIGRVGVVRIDKISGEQSVQWLVRTVKP